MSVIKRKKLTHSFFNRPTVEVAKDLIGKFLVRRYRGKEIAAMITEVEAYDGFNDRASHARHGKTPRNTPMFGEPGRWYVYFTYGMHWMLNIVTREAGYPAAVLIRGVKTSSGKEIKGPARVTKFFNIDRRLNDMPAVFSSGLWLEDSGIAVPRYNIKKSPRIGIDHAGRYWAKKPWRFFI